MKQTPQQLAAGALARIAEGAPRVVPPNRQAVDPAPAVVVPTVPLGESIKADVVRDHLTKHGFKAPAAAAKPEVWNHKNGMEAALFDGGDSTADPTIYLVLKHNPQDAEHDAMASAINQQLDLHAWQPESIDAFGMDSELFEVWGAASVGVIVIHSTNKPWDKRHGHYSRSGIKRTIAAQTPNQTVRKQEGEDSPVGPETVVASMKRADAHGHRGKRADDHYHWVHGHAKWSLISLHPEHINAVAADDALPSKIKNSDHEPAVVTAPHKGVKPFAQDGNHRVVAAQQRGDKAVKTWIPTAHLANVKEGANFYPTSAPAGNGGGKDADNTPLSAAQARASAAATCPACSGTRTFATPCACGVRLGGRLAPGSPPPRAKRVRPDELAPKDPGNSYGTTPAASTMDGGYLSLVTGPNK